VEEKYMFVGDERICLQHFFLPKKKSLEGVFFSQSFVLVCLSLEGEKKIILLRIINSFNIKKKTQQQVKKFDRL
jgi:hypothetical protein